jgi:hypothetical protein
MAAAPYAVLLRAFNLAFILFAGVRSRPGGRVLAWQRVHEDRAEYSSHGRTNPSLATRHRLDLDELVGIARTATPSSVLGASWSPKASRAKVPRESCQRTAS